MLPAVCSVQGESAADGVQLVGERHGCLWRNALWMFVAKCAIDVCGEMCRICVADMR